MLPEVREKIRTELSILMANEGLTWDSIHKQDIKETIKSPVGGRTFYRICKPNSEYTTTKNNLHEILKFLRIAYTENYGFFQLIKIPTNETSK